MPFLKTNFESLAPIFVSLKGYHVARRGKEKASMLARCVEGECNSWIRDQLEIGDAGSRDV